ncbi:LysM peptidoglycan-binding domain-containing protein [Sediminibacterium sp.]|uniref:LysM peptidoglycan-binding domain-containing protein n=1 Tax=Sediminibacterium sp. TaxID=1917865 RepID=UPI003F715CBD
MENIKRLTLQSIFKVMYLKKYLFFVVVGFINVVNAQEKLVAMGVTGNIYIQHTVKGKETLSILSRIYGATPKQIAAYNKINPNSVLSMGVKIRIPLTQENLVQEQEFASSERVYHIAGKGENLFRISQRYFKVPIAQLREWNQLSADAVAYGQELVVGYIGGVKLAAMRADASSSPNAVSPNTQVFVKPPVIGKPVVEEIPPLKDPNIMDATVDGVRELKNGVMKPLTESDKFFAKVAADKAKKEAEAAANIVPPPVPVEQFKQSNQPPPTEYRINDDNINYTPKSNDEGYFGQIFATDQTEKNKINKAGDVGIFKSVSGFSDRKFYALLNDVLPGTIVRITTADNRSVCARVLGPVPEIKGAPALLMRVSNATAAALGKSDTPFSVNITYLQ